jgi:hypothetical protein
MMKTRPSLKNQVGYKGHFLDAECHCTATDLHPQQMLIFMGLEACLTNLSCQRTFFTASRAEKWSFLIRQMHLLAYPAGNMTNP